MDDLIRRHLVRLIESDSNAYPQVWNEDYEKGFCDAINRVLDLPSAQKKGHWVTTKSIDNEYFQMCDVCQRMASVRTNFCPNCGADMREDGETHERKQIYVEKIV